MDIYEDRTDWQMNDHVDYNSEPLEWSENVFREELGAQDEGDDDDTAAVPGLEDDDDEAEGDGDDDEAEGG